MAQPAGCLDCVAVLLPSTCFAVALASTFLFLASEQIRLELQADLSTRHTKSFDAEIIIPERAV